MSRIVFVGKNPYFNEILKYAWDTTGINICGIFFEPEQYTGIGKWLEESGIEGHPLDLLNNPEQAVPVLKNMRPDYLINYNAILIFKPEILAVPQIGSLNMHPGLLPAYAGLHTHQWAIRHGEPEFGSTLHWMEPRVDTGEIVFQEKFPLTGKETGFTLYIECLRAGVLTIEKALDIIGTGQSLPRTPQDLTFRKVYLGRDALYGTVDWKMEADKILRFFRAADYGFFDSPTYKPHTRYNGQQIFLHKSQPGNPTTARPGTIVARQNGHIEVACGDAKSILVAFKKPTEMELKVGEVFE